MFGLDLGVDRTGILVFEVAQHLEFEKILEQTGPPLLHDVDLILKGTSVCRLCMLNLPAEVLDLGLELGLLILKLRKMKRETMRSQCLYMVCCFLPVPSLDWIPCNKRMGMCTEGYIGTWPTRQMHLANIASRSKCRLLPWPSEWFYSLSFLTSGLQVSCFWNGFPTATEKSKLIKVKMSTMELLTLSK